MSELPPEIESAVQQGEDSLDRYIEEESEEDSKGKTFNPLIRTDDIWAPYIGPQEGEGWRNLETDVVVYDDEPPGRELTPELAAELAGYDESDPEPTSLIRPGDSDWLEREGIDLTEVSYAKYDKPVLTRDEKNKLEEGLKNRHDEDEVEEMYRLTGSWKSTSYSDDAQTRERAYMQAADIDGEPRNGSLIGREPSQEMVDVCKDMVSASQEFIREHYADENDEFEVHRGLSRGVGYSVWGKVFKAFATDTEVEEMELELNPMTNYALESEVAHRWGRNTVQISQKRPVNDVVAATDQIMSGGETEISLVGNTQSVDISDVKIKDEVSVKELLESPEKLSDEQMEVLISTSQTLVNDLARASDGMSSKVDEYDPTSIQAVESLLDFIGDAQEADDELLDEYSQELEGVFEDEEYPIDVVKPAMHGVISIENRVEVNQEMTLGGSDPIDYARGLLRGLGKVPEDRANEVLQELIGDNDIEIQPWHIQRKIEDVRREIDMIDEEPEEATVDEMMETFNEIEAAAKSQAVLTVNGRNDRENIDWIAESREEEESTEKSGDWTPYVGPQDGFGWTDGDEVLYQPEPPGGIDVSDLDEDEIDELREYLEEEGIDPDEYIESEELEPVDIGDVEHNDVLIYNDEYVKVERADDGKLRLFSQGGPIGGGRSPYRAFIDEEDAEFYHPPTPDFDEEELTTIDEIEEGMIVDSGSASYEQVTSISDDRINIGFSGYNAIDGYPYSGSVSRMNSDIGDMMLHDEYGLVEYVESGIQSDIVVDQDGNAHNLDLSIGGDRVYKPQKLEVVTNQEIPEELDVDEVAGKQVNFSDEQWEEANKRIRSLRKDWAMDLKSMVSKGHAPKSAIVLAANEVFDDFDVEVSDEEARWVENDGGYTNIDTGEIVQKPYSSREEAKVWGRVFEDRELLDEYDVEYDDLVEAIREGLPRPLTTEEEALGNSFKSLGDISNYIRDAVEEVSDDRMSWRNVDAVSALVGTGIIDIPEEREDLVDYDPDDVRGVDELEYDDGQAEIVVEKVDDIEVSKFDEDDLRPSLQRLGNVLDRYENVEVERLYGDHSELSPTVRSAFATYTDSKKMITVNPDNFMDRGLAEKVSKLYEEGGHATRSPEDTMIHEAVHALHHQLGDSKPDNMEISDSDAEIIEEEVSEYAASNHMELVAEVGTMLLTGRGDEISDHVLMLYQKYGGPEL